MGYIYRYRDVKDNKIKYVGIVWSDNRSLRQRLMEHARQDDWCKGKKWNIDYIPNINTREEAELLEGHFISLYNTGKYYNKAKTNLGINKFLRNLEDEWIHFDEKLSNGDGYYNFEENYVYIKTERKVFDLEDDLFHIKYNLNDKLIIPIKQEGQGGRSEFKVEHILKIDNTISYVYFVQSYIEASGIKYSNIWDGYLDKIEATIPNDLKKNMILLPHNENKKIFERKLTIPSYYNMFEKIDNNIKFDGINYCHDRQKQRLSFNNRTHERTSLYSCTYFIRDTFEGRINCNGNYCDVTKGTNSGIVLCFGLKIENK